MLKLVVSMLILASSAAAFAAGQASRSPRFVVNLLDYVAADYGGAVVDGKVVSQAEYDEQIEFVDAATESLSLINETKADAALIEQLKTLKAKVLAKAPAAEIAQIAQKAKLDVIRAANVELAPESWPNIANGKRIYSERCVSCHGVTGLGDGPAGKGLEPPAANFHGEGMAASSPFKSFNVIRVGVPGTGMMAFDDLSDKEVWDLAFFVNSLRFTGKKVSTQETSASLSDVAGKTDSELAAMLPGSETEKQEMLAALRLKQSDNQNGNSLHVAKSELQAALKNYEAGDVDTAKTNALTAYLEGIEPIEPALRGKDSAFVTELELKMAAVRSAIEKKEPITNVQAAVTQALGAVIQAETLFATQSENSATLTLTLAAGILLREGFEAILILIALLAVIRAAGDARAARWVHGGWIVAVALGVAAWFLSGWLMTMSGIGREAMEGTIALLAVVVLLYVGFWLHRRTEIQRWKQFIEGHVKQLIAGRNLFGLAAISFMAVFREAFETVLFLRAIWIDASEAGRNAMWIGVFGAFGVVLFVAWALIQWSAKLPLRKVFTVSSIMIIALAIILAGKGVNAFQETGWISLTRFSDFRIELIGFYATLETILAQLITLVVSAIAWVAGNKPPSISPVSTGA